MRHVRPHDFGPEHMERVDRFGHEMFFGGFLYLLLVALLVTVIVLLAINMRRGNTLRPVVQAPSGVMGTRDPAIESARMRLARGEINREEFEEINRALGGQSPPGPSGQT